MIELRETQAGQAHIGRGQPAGLGLAAVRDQLAQRRQVAVGQPRDRFAAIVSAAEAPAEGQLPVADLAVDAQAVARALERADKIAEWLGSGGEGPLVVQYLVELPEVVEGELRRRAGLHSSARRRAPEVAQQPVADPVGGHGAQLLLHRHQGCAQPGLPAQVEHNWVEAGEPANGAADIGVGEELLAPVALQVYAHARHAAPLLQGQGQGRQQHLADLSAVGRGNVAQQRPVVSSASRAASTSSRVSGAPALVRPVNLRGAARPRPARPGPASSGRSGRSASLGRRPPAARPRPGSGWSSAGSSGRSRAPACA